MNLITTTLYSRVGAHSGAQLISRFHDRVTQSLLCRYFNMWVAELPALLLSDAMERHSALKHEMSISWQLRLVQWMRDMKQSGFQVASYTTWLIHRERSSLPFPASSPLSQRIEYCHILFLE